MVGKRLAYFVLLCYDTINNGEVRGETAVTLNMVYASDVIEDAIEVLQNVDYRGGMAPVSFLQGEVQRLRQQGRRAADAVNVALVAMGKKATVTGAQSTEAQMTALVARLQREQPNLIASIKWKRAEKGK